MAELDDIYAPELLEKSANISHIGHLDSPDAFATAHSKMCGSTISVEIKMNGNIVTDYAQQVEACLLGQSAAAIMADNIIGASADELREVGAKMRKMLKEEGTPPNGKWGELRLLENVRHFRARHASTLLVFDAVEEAVSKMEIKK